MNIRLTLAATAVALGATVAFAVPAKPGLRTYRNPDGTTISLRLVGDEHFHTYVTADGLTVGRAADGFFHYRSAEGLSAMRASDPAARPETESQFLNSRNVESFSVKSLLAPRRTTLKSRRKAMAPAADNQERQVPSLGSPRIPVLLVQYSDYKFKDSDPNKTFHDFFATGEKSAHQYFVDQSNGKFNPVYDVYGPVTLPNKRAYYGGNDSDGNDLRVCTMVGEACERLDSQINFRNYDNNGDGECDVVIVLYAGDGEASSYDEDAEDAVWPCQWALSSKDSDFAKGALTLDGTRVDMFAVFNELNGSDLTQIDGVGTFCHEFSHCLGLPDFYDTQYGPHFGMGPWSLLDSGSYNDDGYTPVGYSAYEKNFMGWLDIPEVKADTRYTLTALNQGSAETDMAVKLTNDADPDEYFIIENRARKGWDAYMTADGLFIYHVTYDKDAWDQNYVNDYDLQRMTPVPADGELQLDSYSYFGEMYYSPNEEGLLGDFWPWKENTEWTDETTPAAAVNTGSFLSKPVTEMTRNADGSISFWTMKTPLPSIATPTGIEHTVLSETSARISWTAGDANATDYLLQVYPHRDITWSLIYDEDFTKSGSWETLWDTEGYTAMESDGLRFGSNKQPGGLISPAFDLDGNRQVTVAFTAKAYGNDDSSVVVSVLDENNKELDTKTVALSSQHKAYSLVLDAATSGKVTVWFETTGKKARFYLKDARIYVGDASEEVAKARRAAAADNVMEITVKGATEYTLTGLEAKQKYDYRLRALSPDETAYNHSGWSEVGTFNLGDTTGITIPAADADETEALYYTLQGQRAAQPLLPGLYIRVHGNKATKILVK